MDGDDNSTEAPPAEVIPITQGDRRDLNQVVLNLTAEHPAGRPLFRQPLNGNSEAKAPFKRVVETHLAPLCQAAPRAYWVADSALYTQATLQSLGARKWAAPRARPLERGAAGAGLRPLRAHERPG